MTNEPVIVETYDDSIAAHLARARLDSEGIEAWVLDEHLVTYDPLISRAVGGVKVMVSQADQVAAREILARKAVAEPSVCPKCGSMHVTQHQAGRRSAFLTLLLLGIPIGRARPKSRCVDCQHTWRQ